MYEEDVPFDEVFEEPRAAAAPAPPVSVTPTAVLGADGPISALMQERELAAGERGSGGKGGFEARPEQIEMAEAVARAMAAGATSTHDAPDPARHLFVEAGTGVGKSFAYLVPAIIRAVTRGERVVVATNTISLQEQLVTKDIPLLQETLANWGLPTAGEGGVALKPVLVKGRGNYLSVRRLKLASSRQVALFPDGPARRSLHVIEDWAYSTADGTLSTMPPVEKMSIWDRVQSDPHNCMGKRCPTHDVCFYQNARKQMAEANLLICNHALFFSDLALRASENGFLPAYRHVVLDEAHTVEDAASDHFGLALSEGRVFHLLSGLYNPRTNKGYLPQLRLLTSGDEPLDAAHKAVLSADAAARELFTDLAELLNSGDLSGGGRIPPPPYEHMIENRLTPAMKALALRLKGMRDDAAEMADRFELLSYAERAESIAAEAEALLNQTVPGCVYWVEQTGGGSDDDSGGQNARVKIACSPIEVGPLLKEHLFDKPISVVLTSATLATKAKKTASAKKTHDASKVFKEDPMQHVMQRLGCSPPDHAPASLVLGSPFDYANQVELFVEADLPSPVPGGNAGGRQTALWSRARSEASILGERILEHLHETDGGAFVLFTSFQMLRNVAAALDPRLTKLGMPMLVQGRDGPRQMLLERFRQDPRSVLLGAASFWQGVDVRGDGLRNVIITKLPFEPPDRPLTQARLERIQARGGSPFMEDSLPRAIIRFKQGFGRLIRSHTDKGRVVVLDPRVVTARYGRLFLDALPPGVKVQVRK